MAKLNSTIVTGNLRVTSDIYLSGSLSNGTNTYTLPSASGTLALTSQVPTVNNGTLTIQANGVSKGTFTANQSGNSTINITASDLGLSSAMHFLGTTTSSISDGSTTNPVTIGGNSVTAVSGDVVLYSNKEFVWTGSAWEILGDEGSYALNSVQVIAGTGLSGGGAISGNVTLNHSNSVTAQTTQALYPITYDAQGHITGAGSAVTSLPANGGNADTVDNEHASAFAHLAGGTSSSHQSFTGFNDFSQIVTFSGGVATDTIQSTRSVASGGDVSFDSTVRLAAFKPANDNDYSLGTSSLRWKNVYVSGNISDGTKSVSISNIVDTTSTQSITGNKNFLSSSLSFNHFTYPTTTYIDYGGLDIVKGSSTTTSIGDGTIYTAWSLQVGNLTITRDDGNATYFQYTYGDNDYAIHLPTASGDLALTSDIPYHGLNTAIVADATHNINGKELSNFQATDITISGYPGIKIVRDDNKLTKAEAARYMAAQTGSDYVPEYDYDKPSYPYMIFANGKLYKPQWDSTNGLVLYYMNQIAFASQIPSTSNYVTTNTNQTITGAKTFRNGIIVGDSNASSCNIQMYDAANGELSVDGIILNDNYYNFFDYNSNYVYFSAVYECLGFYSDAYGGEFEYSFPHKSGTFAMTSDCGTKLYKHEIVETTQSVIPSGRKIIVYSTSSTKATTGYGIDTLMKTAISAKLGSYYQGNLSTVIAQLLYSNDMGNPKFIVEQISNGTVTQSIFSFLGTASFTDTVTEL